MCRDSREAHVPPRHAGVGRLVDAVAVGDVDADRRLAGAGVDDVPVGGRHGQRPDRSGREEAIGDVLPELAGVVALPHAAGDGAEVEDRLVLRVGGNGDHPSTTGAARCSDIGFDSEISDQRSARLNPVTRRARLISCTDERN